MGRGCVQAGQAFSELWVWTEPMVKPWLVPLAGAKASKLSEPLPAAGLSKAEVGRGGAGGWGSGGGRGRAVGGRAAASSSGLGQDPPLGTKAKFAFPLSQGNWHSGHRDGK